MNSDPLAQLRDIHLPDPVGWWPPAPGWWILTISVVGLLGWSGYLLVRYFKRRRYRKAALKELALLKQYSDSQAALEQIAILLRRVAIQSFGREVVAGLTGQKWLDFLDRTGRTRQFVNGPGEVLGEILYQKDREIVVEPLIQLCEEWIRRHKQC